MRVLALDTTTSAGSAALVEDDRVIAEEIGDPARPHAERLPGDLTRLLDAAGVPPAEVDIFAVAAGPGSFTGLRIGIATMQGLAFVNRRRIVAVSSLEAMAQIASRGIAPGSLVAAWMDAHRSEVFAALYEVRDAPIFSRARLLEIDPASVEDPRSLARWIERLRVEVVTGDGAAAYKEWLGPTQRVSPMVPLAGAIGLMAVARAHAGETVDPAGVQPLYVRRPDAEVARERNSPPDPNAPPRRTRRTQS